MIGVRESLKQERLKFWLEIRWEGEGGEFAFQERISGNFVTLHKLRGRLPATGTTGKSALQRILEGVAEVAVEVRIDERVQSTVEVTYPEEQRHHCVRAVAGLAAQRCRQIPERTIEKNRFLPFPWKANEIA